LIARSPRLISYRARRSSRRAFLANVAQKVTRISLPATPPTFPPFWVEDHHHGTLYGILMPLPFKDCMHNVI
jgi:hypothetical protein